MMTAALRLLRGTDDGLHFNTTDDAYQNLIDGSKDVIFVTAPSADELAAAAKAGVRLEVIPVVKDALVFLANTANPVDGLTRQQVQDIYTGKVTNWQDVGGADEPIVAYQRPEDSGSQTLFEQLAMPGVKPMPVAAAHRPEDMAGLVDVIAQYDNSDQAIGYSVFYYTQQMYAKDNVKLLSIDGVAPSRESIADGSYAYLTYYYAVVRADSLPGSTARQLVDWCLSSEGQRVFARASYVPLSADDIVEPDSGYGYHGSTPENTTQSSGTGGPAGKRVAYSGDPCLDVAGLPDCVAGTDTHPIVKVPGYPKVSQAANAWLAALPPVDNVFHNEDGTLDDETPVTTNADITDGLLVVDREVSGGDNQYPARRDSAVFRLSDGYHMQLSDFFYDGVNYIDYINRNLLNDGTNSFLFDCGGLGNGCGERAAPFTGLPADTLDFTYSDCGILQFDLRAGNPFLVRSGDGPGDTFDSIVPLSLPYDLSPYGLNYRIDAVQVGKVMIDQITSNYNSVNPHDAPLNAAIRKWVLAQGTGDTANAFVYTDDKSRILVSVSLTAMSKLDETGDLAVLASATFDWATGKRVS